MPCDYRDYPDNWRDIRRDILIRAANRCEGSPQYLNCRAADRQPHPVTGSKVVLTIAHLDHDTNNSDPANLRAWCQRCHLTYDGRHHAATRRRKKACAGQLAFNFDN
jgi:5-methylcytosine-specific restriction endonuclease McrA